MSGRMLMGSLVWVSLLYLHVFNPGTLSQLHLVEKYLQVAVVGVHQCIVNYLPNDTSAISEGLEHRLSLGSKFVF